MTMIQYLSAFRLYSSEVLLLALGVTLVTSLLKKTLLKNMQSKVYVSLPFALGLVCYAVFRMIVTTGVLPLTKELGATIEGGFATGCAATLYYVVWEQFFRGKSTKLPLAYPLLAGFVEEEQRLVVARELEEGSAFLEAEALISFIKETLDKYALQSVTDEEKQMLATLIAGYLLSVRGNVQ